MDPVDSGPQEIVVKLVEFGKPDKNGQVFSYANFQQVVNGPLLSQVTKKCLYGEYMTLASDKAGVVDVEPEKMCLRVKRLRLTPAGLFGVIVPAGPLKGKTEEFAALYQQPLPLAMRALVQPNPNPVQIPVNLDGTISSDARLQQIDVLRILSFDLTADSFQGHPKIDHSRPIPPPPSEAEVIQAANQDLQPKVDVMDNYALRDELEPYFQNAFSAYIDLLEDPETKRVIGPTVRYIKTDYARMIEWQSMNDIWRLISDADGSHIRVEKHSTHIIDKSSRTRDVRAAFDLLARVISDLAELYVPGTDDTSLNPSRKKDRKMNANAAPKAKKPSAKDVFKNVEPIVSKNVLVHFQGVFRVRPGTKMDGHLKKLDGKAGAFVRKEGDPDIYVLPYTVLSEKKSAAERSLRSALETRKISIVDTSDLKGA